MQNKTRHDPLALCLKNGLVALFHCHFQPLCQFLKHSVHVHQTQREVCVLICETEMKGRKCLAVASLWRQ